MPIVSLSTFIDKSNDLKKIDDKFPSPERPSSGESYSFPANADNLSDSQIDSWLAFFGAWRGYMNYEISKVDGELYILEQGYKLVLSTKVATLEADSPKKLLKDSLEGQAILEDEQLQRLKIRIIEMTGHLKILRGRLSLYDSQFETLSRLITRRGQERMKMSI